MAADLRAEKPEMKGKAIRKKVCAAWSKHCFALPLSARLLSGPRMMTTEQKKVDDAAEKE